MLQKIIQNGIRENTTEQLDGDIRRNCKGDLLAVGPGDRHGRDPKRDASRDHDREEHPPD